MRKLDGMHACAMVVIKLTRRQMGPTQDNVTEVFNTLMNAAQVYCTGVQHRIKVN